MQESMIMSYKNEEISQSGNIGNNWKLPPYALRLATFKKVLAHNVVVNLSMFNLVRHSRTVSPK